MGQQQLLLIVLGVILVGVAVVLGIQYFSVGAEEGAKDELVAHSLTIGANAQQWFNKPVAMGGGGNAFNTSSGAKQTFVQHFDADLTGLHSSTNGTYSVALSGDTAVTVTAAPVTALGYGWTVTTLVGPKSMQSTISN